MIGLCILLDVLEMRLAPGRNIGYLFWSVAEFLLFATSTMRRKSDLR